MPQLGKYSTDRDSALHYLCTAEWSMGSFGDVDSPTGYVWRIQNTWEDVKPVNTEFTSLIEEWLESEDVADSEEFRRSLVGNYLLQEDSNGFVHVREFASMAELNDAYRSLASEYDAWAEDYEAD